LNKPDPFLELVKTQETAKSKRFLDALSFAKSEVYTASGEAFVRSCSEFFDCKGYLTDNQVVALYSIDKRRDWHTGEVLEDEDFDDDGGVFPSWDGSGDIF
jgi:hypothetical protein